MLLLVRAILEVADNLLLLLQAEAEVVLGLLAQTELQALAVLVETDLFHLLLAHQ